MMRRSLLWGLMALFLWSGVMTSPATMEGQPQAKLQTIKLRVGQAPLITAEVARRPGEMAMGLMFRKSLGDNEGMLFVFGQERRASFWMANTYIPLTVAYLDREGVILELHDLKPLDMTPVVSKSDRVAFALEMNRGWFALNGVKVGDRIVPEGTTWARLKAPLPRQRQFDR
ncbi:MAG: DUF192 domain-containing protein [Methylacidiphilales bacterium]|nr:DUF192 domain-containing protein [Candidatus Methylacidiphilales bacterium]MDW8349464.1 DUF192 domain-containing protein [Verrucomicrobiae bacterium]